MASEIIYEPRALWSVQSLTPTTANRKVGLFPREHFRNGWRHPITLTRMLICGVGYTLQEYAGASDPPAADTDRHCCAAALQECNLFVKAPSRQMFTLRNLRSTAFSPAPHEDISMRGAPANGYANAMLGILRWDFDRPLRLPGDAGLDFRLGGVLLQGGAAAPAGTTPVAEIAFYEGGAGSAEPGSFFRHNARVLRDRMPYRMASGFPLASDGLTVGAGNSAESWVTRFTPSEYRRQSDGRSGPSTLFGFGVHLDQIGFEDQLQLSADPNVPGQQAASIAMRCPSFCRVVGGGSQAEWWRAGAPLALVCPTITPAQVYELDRPITLHKGDLLEVELEVPGQYSTISPTYQIGVSFTGFAAVEG